MLVGVDLDLAGRAPAEPRRQVAATLLSAMMQARALLLDPVEL